jgi:ABC-type multidrug transport system fused ATPase/permease subunit
MERIHEYLGIDQEPKNGIQPPAAWPSKQGIIEVEGLTARYAPHLPLALKSVSFSVKAGEKIGESVDSHLPGEPFTHQPRSARH